MGVCSACGRKIEKGKPCFTCNDCYSMYCLEDGYACPDGKGGYKCMNCTGELGFIYCYY